MDVKLFIGTQGLPSNNCPQQNKLILAIFKCTVSMSTHNAILQNVGVPTKSAISQLLLSL